VPNLLLVAKAPVAGVAKTRLATVVGAEAAADLAAAALLDTLDAAEAWVAAPQRLVALAGSLRPAARGAEIRARLGASGWCVVDQLGPTFSERIVQAHHDAAAVWGPSAALVQIGADTPQVTPEDLDRLVAAVASAGGDRADTSLGPAADGGWWGLATRRAGYVDDLRTVEMSTPRTCARTAAMLRAGGASVAMAHQLSDVDTFADALDVAALIPDSRFAAAVNALDRAEIATA
jgi:glycosyltransferase A (GT-A) superfamily protein (DUF2064 family)